MEVEVRVTDRGGRPVDDLTKEDFTLLENGTPQEIATFEFVRTPGSLRRLVPDAVKPRQQVAGREPTAREMAFEELRRSTLIYIAVRIGREDRPVAYRAIKKFIDENLQPGVLISLEGTPFTSDKRRLLSSLDSMMRRGFQVSDGEGGSLPGLMDVLTVQSQQELEFDERSEQFDALVEELNEEFSTLATSLNQRRAYFAQLSFYRYIDLIKALSIYPGKKVVVLFSRGFRVDDENLDLMDSFANQAMRARVSFYVSDIRRLQALVPGGDASQRGSFAGLRGDPTQSAFRTQMERHQDDQDGLYELAARSGGRAVLNTNDLSEIFEAVTEGISNYYLLGYYPKDLTRQGRLRRIRVSVNRPGVKTVHRRGYYEPQEFSKMSRSERNLQLHQAVQFDTPYTDIPLTLGFEFFRGPDRNPVLAYSVGIHSRSIPVKQTKKGAAMDFTIVARARGTEEDPRPVYDERRLHMVVKPDYFERFQSDPSAFLHYTSQMSLRPGTYDWKVVLRDDNGGKMGTYNATVKVPNFGGLSASSSLLLTGRAIEIPPPEKVAKKTGTRRQRTTVEFAGTLDVGATRFYPDSFHVFRQGDPIYLLYDLYNVPSRQLTNPPSAKLALFVNKQRVENLLIQAYQVLPVPERQEIRYTARLNTSNLQPGEYFLLALLPQSGGAEAPLIYRKFTLVGDNGREQR